MLGASSLPSQPGGAPAEGRAAASTAPALVGCALPRLRLDHYAPPVCSALLTETPVMGSFPQHPGLTNGLFSPGEERPSRKDMALLPVASLGTRVLFCCPCRSLKPQLHSRPEIEDMPSLLWHFFSCQDRKGTLPQETPGQLCE